MLLSEGACHQAAPPFALWTMGDQIQAAFGATENRGAYAPHRAPKVVARSDFWEEASSRVVHLVFDRVRGMFEADHLGHLQLDIAVDEIVIEHAPGREEGAVLVETGERVA
jgi:hypothetical protein